MLKKIMSGFSAGLCVSIGGVVFLSCVRDGSKPLGAILFSVALLCICYKGYSLYTGKIGLIPENHDRDAVETLLTGLLGNLIGAVFAGLMTQVCDPSLMETAKTICTGKLAQTPAVLAPVIRGIFCGVLMYLAVTTFRESKTPLGILFCIPVFILCGFEHSIADMYYFAASGIVSFEAFLYLMLVVIGNSIGGMLLPVVNGLTKTGKAQG